MPVIAENSTVSTLTDHARSMISYNRWANERIFRAARALPAEQFAGIADTLAHVLGTQLWWYSNWAGESWAEPQPRAYDELKSEFEASHAQLHAYGERLDDDEWGRVEAWWKQWDHDEVAPVGSTLFQVIYHGIQHRSEVAVTLTERGASPGDLDYLNFLQETAPR
jgi:uncharacterized damage-inducible protein DinB